MATGDVVTGDVVTGEVVTGEVVTGEVATGGDRERPLEAPRASAMAGGEELRSMGSAQRRMREARSWCRGGGTGGGPLTTLFRLDLSFHRRSVGG